MLFENRAKNDLNSENDLFGITNKGDAIISVLQNLNDLKNNNMIALYGEWGCGKTSLMQYIINNINNVKRRAEKKLPVKTIFFEAWKYEKQENLELSLLEQIIDEVLGDKKLNGIVSKSTEGLKETALTLLDLGKNILFNSKISIPGMPEISLDLGQAAKDTKKEMTEYSDKKRLSQKKSIYSQQKEFTEKFNKLEKMIKKKYSNLIVFIDDLDRCEPQNVLNLLSSIKLFFVHNSDFVYFCGIDKDAVKKSIKLRYQDVIKSNEYLEKIFDITFEMPTTDDCSKIINEYFKDSVVKDDEGLGYKYIDTINLLFTSTGFTNPRHIKKVFNKFELLRRFRAIVDDSRFPAIDNDANIISIIFILYLIILHEFKRDTFDELFSYDKLHSLVEFNNAGDRSFYCSSNQQINITYLFEQLQDSNISINRDIFQNMFGSKVVENSYLLIMFFLPKIRKSYTINPECNYNIALDRGDNKIDKFIDQFSDNSNQLEVGFCKYLLYLHKHTERITSKSKEDIFTIKQLVRCIELYL